MRSAFAQPSDWRGLLKLALRCGCGTSYYMSAGIPEMRDLVGCSSGHRGRRHDNLAGSVASWARRRSGSFSPKCCASLMPG